MACALVHAWQAEAPAAVEYVPAGQAWQAFPTRRNPALQILFQAGWLGPSRIAWAIMHSPGAVGFAWRCRAPRDVLGVEGWLV